MFRLIQIILFLTVVVSCITSKSITNSGIVKCQTFMAETSIERAYSKVIGDWSFISVKTTGWTDEPLKVPYKTILRFNGNQFVKVFERNKVVATFKIKLLRYPNSPPIRFEISGKRGSTKFYLPEKGVFFVCDNAITFGDSEVDGVDYTLSKMH